MAFYPVFLSVVYVVRNQADDIGLLAQHATDVLGTLVSDYELIIVDNASTDDTIAKLKAITADDGLPNVQVYTLVKEVDADTAFWVGLENALGDFVAALDPLSDDIQFLPQMLDKATSGTDVVFASNRQQPRQRFLYRSVLSVLNRLYQMFSGLNLAKDAPQYRLLSKRVVNYILQHPQPALSYRHLPASGGFTRANMVYSSAPGSVSPKRLRQSIDRGMRLLVTTSRAPLRLVTWLTLFGAASNVLYSVYVLLVSLIKDDIAPGWVSLSLQQSGMFFLLSMVLLVLSEYILQMARLSNDGPLYHVAQEFTSSRMTRREKLNIEDVGETNDS